MKLRYLAWGLLAAGVSLSCSSVVWAAGPLQGMGSAAPATVDRSVSPRWHVYTFIKDGIEYVQVNDTAGRVRAGVAAIAGLHLVLPMGVDADHVSTPESPLAVGAIRGSEVVYTDPLVSLSVGVSDAGQYVWTVSDAMGPASGQRYAPADGDASNCKQDPNSCPINRANRVVMPAATATPADDLSNCKQDPNSCPINRITRQVQPLSTQDTTTDSNCKQDPNSCPINRIGEQ
jgi:hypothetical protein